MDFDRYMGLEDENILAIKVRMHSEPIITIYRAPQNAFQVSFFKDMNFVRVGSPRSL